MNDLMMLVVSAVVLIISVVLLFLSVHDHDADQMRVPEVSTVKLRSPYKSPALNSNRQRTEIMIDQNSDVEKFSEDELDELDE